MNVKETRPLFAPRTPDNIPVWPRLRNIDGYVYMRETTHATQEEAEARRDAIRENGDPAQVFSSATPKFVPVDGDTVTADAHCVPRFAAVYTLPKGKMISHNEEGTEYEVVINPKIAEREAAAAAKAEEKALKAEQRKAAKKAAAKKPAKKAAKKD